MVLPCEPPVRFLVVQAVMRMFWFIREAQVLSPPMASGVLLRVKNLSTLALCGRVRHAERGAMQKHAVVSSRSMRAQAMLSMECSTLV